jgi:hypothetical protein
MCYPKRTSTHQLEEISQRFFINSLPRNWLAEKPQGDYGVDLRVDIFEGENAIGLELLVQLKSSSEGTDDDVVKMRLNTRTYKYLWDKLAVVMLVKYIAVENEAYWLLLSDVPEPSAEKETFTINIPKINRLSSIDWQAIHQYVYMVTMRKIDTRRRFTFRGNV